MIDRRLKKQLRASVLALTDAALTYLSEEARRELTRRRVDARARRKKKAATQAAKRAGDGIGAVEKYRGDDV